EVNSIQELGHKMITEMIYPSELSESVNQLDMGLLLLSLIKNIDKVQHITKEESHQYILLTSLKYNQDKFKTAILSELAEELIQSDYTLSKYIKEASQLTFKELLQEKRLSIAKELLSGTKITITRIIEEVGYNNVSYFYRIFKN